MFAERISFLFLLSVFQKIKDSISADALLALPDISRFFILTTNASAIGSSAVLSQVQNGIERTIAYCSRLHNSAQTRYSTTDQELLALVTSIEHFRPYLLTGCFKLRTDHKALIYLVQTKNNKSRLLRWSLALQGYDFLLEHVSGRKRFRRPQ